VLAGAFNPPTVAHLALADAALARVDHVLMVLPGVLPHKAWEGTSKEQRLDMMRAVAGERVSAGVSEGGLYIDIAREVRSMFPEAEILLVLGRDAVERLVTWHEHDPEFFREFTAEFRLLVASRQGSWEPDARVAHAAETLDAGSEWDEVSSTRVRELITCCDEGWRALVPAELHDIVLRLYSAAP
jgi:nicotinic acid mononucleotide adenylyltransferase